MAKYILALGSSHINGVHYINSAESAIANHRAFLFHGKSRIYKNKLIGAQCNSLCYNSAFLIECTLHPRALYRELMKIEYMLGRIRTYRNARRTLDIDVLMALDFTYISSNFFIPHQEALNRNFFVMPALDALKSASWPIPFVVRKASAQLGRGYLGPLPYTHG